MTDLDPFLPWIVGASCSAELAVIRAVTGNNSIPVEGAEFPTDAADLAHVVLLVEQHHLHNMLGTLCDDRQWWRIVANWDRLVNLLDTEEPGWRAGKHSAATAANAEIVKLYDRPPAPRRRILLDMDGPIADFDAACFDWCARNGVTVDIDSPDDQTHRYFTAHIADPDERAALRTEIDTDGWYRSLPVTPGAQAGVEQLLSSGHDIVICSKPHDDAPHCTSEKLGWLAEHFPTLDHFIFTRDKSLAYGGTGHRGILLDDAIVSTQVSQASWEPVCFAAPFNGPGTEWGRFPRWKWGDPTERLTW